MPLCRGQWYNPEKGFGFIAPENGEKDIFVHGAQTRSGPSMLMEGQKVFVQMRAGQKKAWKFEIFASLSQMRWLNRNRASDKEKARCREEVAAGSISNETREEVRPTQRRHTSGRSRWPTT